MGQPPPSRPRGNPPAPGARGEAGPDRAPLPGRPVRGSRTGRPIMALLDLLGRRWALRVLWELRGDPVPTFRELQDRCGGISSSVLADRVAELRAAGILAPDSYALTPRGHELREALHGLQRWAAGWSG